MNDDTPSPPGGAEAPPPPAAGPPPPAGEAPPGGEPPPASAGEPPPPPPAASEQPSTQLLILKDKVQRYLGELIGSVQLTPDGRYTFQAGSTRVFVTCSTWTADKTLVNVTAPVLMGCPAAPELFEHVASHSDDYLFGHLSTQRDDDGTVNVLLTHVLLGDYLDPDELKQAVGGVVSTADQLDDDLKTRFGGTRFHDDVP